MRCHSWGISFKWGSCVYSRCGARCQITIIATFLHQPTSNFSSLWLESLMHIPTAGMTHDCKVRKMIYKKLLVPNGIFQYLKLWTKIFIFLLLNIQFNLALASWVGKLPSCNCYPAATSMQSTCSISQQQILFTDLAKMWANGKDPETTNFVCLICRIHHFISLLFSKRPLHAYFYRKKRGNLKTKK